MCSVIKNAIFITFTLLFIAGCSNNEEAVQANKEIETSPAKAERTPEEQKIIDEKIKAREQKRQETIEWREEIKE
ncbi:hypothetical protein [Halobacillus sp. B29]|uniref:hypothetical protein n=1 Tax=Halobacillus sp. B29 TaxID=3457432 RepID=UPI003FCCB3DE